MTDEPSADAQAHSQRLVEHIRAVITACGGAIPFADFMALALYAPGLGYYMAGAHKLGTGGDFVTAPEISPLFGQCLARAISPVLKTLGGGSILEVGAGCGTLAVQILETLIPLGCPPQTYQILEISPDLRERQQQTIERQGLVDRVQWLDRLPGSWRGVILANEVVDALPVARFRIRAEHIEEIWVTWQDGGFREFFDPPASPGLIQAVEALHRQGLATDDGYQSEVNLQAGSWLTALVKGFEAGAVYLIDYGYPRVGYYHPERHQGTLRCHYRQQVHADPYRWVGLQDITSDVNFSDLAEAAVTAGLRVSGFTSQAHFLLSLGIDRLLPDPNSVSLQTYLTLTGGIKRLMLPGEMGERFQVLGLSRQLEEPLAGFDGRDGRGRL